MKKTSTVRHRQMDNGKRRDVYLDDATMKKAREIGGGSASRGLRMAVAKYRRPSTRGA